MYCVYHNQKLGGLSGLLPFSRCDGVGRALLDVDDDLVLYFTKKLAGKPGKILMVK